MSKFTVALFADLYRHLEWADAAVWRAVLASDAARQDETLRGALVHLHGVQRAFLDVWTGESIAFREPSDFSDIMQVYAWALPYYTSAQTLLGSLDQAAIEGERLLPWVRQYEEHLGRTFAPTTLGDILFQVVGHTTHHRGQINTRLRALGAEPPLVDYIVWVYFGRPAAEWTSVV